MTRPNVKPRASEQQEQAAIVELLKSIGAAVYVLGVKRKRGDYQGTMMSPGIPDLYAMLPAPPENPVLPMHCQTDPCALWIECKRSGGRLRSEQAEFRRQCEAIGQPHIVGGVDDVLAFLQQHGWVK
jgi:hypothetical protein